MVVTYKSDLLKIYLSLSGSIEQVNRFPLTDFKQQQYKASVISALAKCFQFNVAINQAADDMQAFYFTSFLRGICEDLISLKFLLNLDAGKREDIVREYTLYLLTSSIQIQNQFFKHERPFQPTVYVPHVDKVISAHTQKLNSLWQSLGHRKEKTFPSVEQMAIDSKLKKLYDFLYHATSRAVHFSPNVLLRTGWYKVAQDNPIIEFSVTNFSDYYALFNSHYGTILFLEFIKTFKKYLVLDNGFSSAAKKLQQLQSQLYFFPEIITYEELNLKRPSNMSYKILEMASRMEADERAAFVKALPDILAEVKKRANKK